MTSKKLWARIYFFLFLRWPQKVVDERMARIYAREKERKQWLEREGKK